MPSDQDTDSNELDLQVMEEDESVDDTQTTLEGEGESDAVLNLETEEQKVDKLSPADEQAKKQEEAWLLKVASGKASISDAPAWLQKRLNTRLEASESQPDTEAVVRKVLEKEREDAEFKALQAEIPALSQAQATELNERFKTLRPAGKVVALRAALDAMGISQKVKEAEQRGIAKGKMSFPRSGQPAVKNMGKTISGVPLSTVQDNKAWNKLFKD